MKKDGKWRGGEKLEQIWIRTSIKKELEKCQIDEDCKTIDEVIFKLLKYKKRKNEK